MKIRASTLSKIQVILDNLNTNQRILANDMIRSNQYSFIERNNLILVKTPQNELVEFLNFIKIKCNCG